MLFFLILLGYYIKILKKIINNVQSIPIKPLTFKLVPLLV